jgi:predicted MPP superfamily phosphohydrolase
MPAGGRAALLNRRNVLKGLIGVALGTATGGAAHGFLYERHHLEVTRSAFPIAGLPEALRGVRIGFLTDIHRSQTVLGGDYVTFGDRRFVRPAADALAPLSAPGGVIAVLGNHDDDKDMPAALASKGFTVLKDARTRITVRGEPMDFGGVRYWTRRLVDLAHVMHGALPHAILLAHTPKRLAEAQQLAIPAVISGHTHGGQIVLPGVGAIAAREFPVIAGLAQRQGTTIFVSRGVGTVYLPIRINCPPEVAVLTLEPVMRAS